LSLNLPVPELKLKKVAAQVRPASEDRATAISVPVIALKPWLKNTTI
jgi:hypothetical protein